MTDNELPKLRRERASDAVFSLLRDRILSHAFKPGERLNIKSLAAQTGVSLSPVKEAVNRLASEGLVDIRPQRGTYITDVVPEDIVEVCEIRMALECLAAARAVQNVAEDGLLRLKELLKVG